MTQTNKNTTYHHGNLRLALLNAARELAAENTIDSITLREVARRAGVSHAAPYHHFADKRALLRALAIDAFTELRTQMQLKWHSDPMQNLKTIGLVYVQFALSHPTEFRFMFRRTLCEPKGTPDELTDIANETFEMLIQTIRTMQKLGIAVSGDSQEKALIVWSTIHGLSNLLIDAPIAPQPIPDGYLEHLIDVVQETNLQGLLKRNSEKIIAKKPV
jgi:AcrR family transcriptional regulator